MADIVFYNDIEQQSIEWFALKMGKLGNSRLKDIIDISKKGKLKTHDVVLTAIAGIISEVDTELSNDVEFTKVDVEWGNDNEPIARELIRTSTSFETGGVTNSDYKYFWLSPDLLDLENSKGFEIKCLKSKTFAKWVIKNKIPSEHLVQVLGYFVALPQLETMDFVMFDPRFKKKTMHVITAKREDYKEFIANIEASLKQFDVMVDGYLEIFK